MESGPPTSAASSAVPSTGTAPASHAVDAYTAAQAAQDAAATHSMRTFKIWRGDNGKGQFVDFTTDVVEGMVVLDAVHEIQAKQANDLAVRWNCKAGKCGSCSAEINGTPKLMCMTRLDQLPDDKPVTVEPMRAFPHVRDLVTDVSWNFRVKKKIDAVHAANAGRARRHLAHVSARRRSRSGISEVHRVLSLPGRLPRAARPSEARGVHRAAISRVRRGAGDASAGHGGPRAASCARKTGSDTATSPSAARRCARSTSRSPTTRSFRSRSASWTSSSTRSESS